MNLKHWIQAMRLPSQSYIFVALLAGQLIAWQVTGIFHWQIAVLIHFIGLADQLFIVFANDCADHRSDRLNRTYTPFSGGSRVLVEGHLKPLELLTAARYMALTTMLLACVLGWLFERWLAVGFMAFALLLLWAYSFLPIRLSYRGGGELLQAFGVGVLLPVFAYYSQSGEVLTFPFLAFLLPVIPVQLACAITTALPDQPSDQHSKKRTVPVLLGQFNAQTTVVILHAIGFAFLMWSYRQHDAEHFGWLPSFVLLLMLITFFGSRPGSKSMIYLVGTSIAMTLTTTLAAALSTH